MRTGDVEYATARFVGCCHERIPGSNGLGVTNLFLPEIQSEESEDKLYLRILQEMDEEIIKVNVDTWTVEIDGETTQLPYNLAASSDGF
jgi:hypothetical protein